MSTATLRPELGDFSSIVCLKAIIVGMEEALGDKATAIALIAAGRARGKKLAEEICGDSCASMSLDQVTAQVAQVIGKEGTRLLVLEKIELDGEVYRAYTRETICSAGESQGSERKCTFTLGAVQGVLETVTGKRFRPNHTESVLRGAKHDVFEYTPMG